MSDTTSPAAPASPYGPRRRQKVPAFARYEGTSAWKKDRRRARAYGRFQAAKAAAAPAAKG